MSNFKIEIASVLDREKLVAEIWYSDKLIAEINQEKESLELTLYPFENSTFDFESFIEALKEAKNRLIQ